jgi:hypothetical protein
MWINTKKQLFYQVVELAKFFNNSKMGTWECNTKVYKNEGFYWHKMYRSRGVYGLKCTRVILYKRRGLCMSICISNTVIECTEGEGIGV